ncbi:hypothetical protein FJ951_27150 [Mesorhizobium sp. B2-2-3]|uniref:hypothetical protein n=1 Tax=Mesorhizobium sp. B2-2-3 TaxID=2589963 RepID=UPI0011282801|nr:hypothetical protein [Mesorhizobium sp. B2-2-3]TPM39386.1 hypothetical protein FJ951_27150 [Mesorhizobium sp. B2-2-3]
MLRLVPDYGAFDQVVFLAVEIDMRLQPITPAVGEREDLGIEFVAFPELGIKQPLTAYLSGAEQGIDGNIAAELGLALNRRILPRLGPVEIADRQLGAKGQRAGDQRCRKYGPAKQRARYGGADKRENWHE